MKLFKLLYIIISVLSLHNAFGQSTQHDSEINRINKEMAQAMIEGNPAKTLGYYTDDIISMPDNSRMITGINILRKASELSANSGMKVNYFDVHTIQIIDCDSLLIEIGKYKIGVTIRGTSRTAKDEGKYITVWEKQTDGSLKIKIELWNNDPKDATKTNIISQYLGN